MYKQHSNYNLQILLILCVSIIFTQCSQDNAQKGDRMIIDKLELAENYYHMHSAFKEAFAFLNSENLSELPVGKQEIDGDRLFYSISKGPGRSRAEAKLEAHRKYIDIQYVVSGSEEMGWSPISMCDDRATEYDAEKDIEFFNNEPQSWTQVPPGSFVIFFPEDAHAPLVGDGEIHKVVIKIMVEEK